MTLHILLDDVNITDVDVGTCPALQVLLQTCQATLDSLLRAAVNFERYEQLTSLAVPPELFVEQVRQLSSSISCCHHNCC